VYFSLRRRSSGEFAWERIRRLLLPLVVAIFVVIPPQIYFERRQQGATFGYAEFYPSVFKFVPYPEGSLSWHHLWFVAYILVFSLVGLPLFRAIRTARGQRWISAMVATFERHPPLLYAVTLPNIIVALTLGPHWPTTHNLVSDWANLTGTFLTFLWGFIIASNRGFLDLLTQRRREFMILGFAFAALFFYLHGTGVSRNWPAPPRDIFHELVNSGYAVTWIFGLLGYARAYVTRPGRWLGYATEAVYPFYIFHQTITVAAVYYLAPKPLGVGPKLLLVMSATFGVSWLLFEIVRQVKFLRPFFGLKAETSSGAAKL
jgi:glucans biosynthesis protein C